MLGRGLLSVLFLVIEIGQLMGSRTRHMENMLYSFWWVLSCLWGVVLVMFSLSMKQLH